MSKRIGLLTAGSDCPGLNATIRAIGKAVQQTSQGDLIGFADGFKGLVNDHTVPLEGNVFSGILTAGGTILGTSRDKPGEMSDGTGGNTTVDQTEKAIENYHKHKLDVLVCIGGRETHEVALQLVQRGLNLITLPKSIANDIAGTDDCIGFSSAMEIAAASIDRLHSTAYSLHRIIIVETMGRHTGWLNLAAGTAGGADVILIPEIPYDLHKVARAIIKRNQAGKRFSIVAVSERIISEEEMAFSQRLREMNARMRSDEERQRVDAQIEKIEAQRTDTTFHLSNRLREHTGLETRRTILGYLLRGGAPSAADRVLATQLGTACVEMIHSGVYGIMVALKGKAVEPVPLEEVAGKVKRIPMDHPWILSARKVGTHLGD